jgi:hypothetical protein
MVLTGKQKLALRQELEKHSGWEYDEDAHTGRCVCLEALKQPTDDVDQALSTYHDHLVGVIDKFLQALP